jgi:hypothetical protein
MLICVPAFVFETYRAVGGNTLSWAYVFEWPILGGYAVFMWRRLLREVSGEQRSVEPDDLSPDELEALDKWNEYLREVHKADRSE